MEFQMIDTPPKNTAALYVRVSTDEQAQHGTSMESQEEALKAHCQREGLTITDIYRDDGYSGATLDRPELGRLLRDAKAGKFSLVLSYKTDRLSRSISQVVRLILEDFQNLGIAYRSITEPYDTLTPSGRMFFVQLASFADFERSSIRDRSKLGKRKAAAQGRMMNAKPPWGYMKDAKGFWAIHPKEGETYKDMVRWLLGGESTRTIALKLNERGISPRYSPKWKAGVIYAILKNPVQKGRGTYGGETFEVPSLISESRWNSVQALLTSNRNRTQPKVSHFALLRGLVRCGVCGRNYFSVPKSKKHAANYYCLSVRPDPEPRYCGSPHVSQKVLDGVVWGTVSRLVKDGDFLRKQLDKTRSSTAGKSIIGEAETVGIDAAIRRKESELSRLLGLYTRSSSFTPEELDREAVRVKDEMAGLLKERATIQATVRAHEAARSAVGDIEAMLAKARDRIDHFTPEERRAFLLRLVRGAVVRYDEAKNLSVELKMAFDLSTPDGKDGEKSTANAKNVFEMVLTA